MKKYILYTVLIFLISSCSHKKQIVYVDNIQKDDLSKIFFKIKNQIEIGDILKIDVNTVIPEVSAPFNKLDEINTIQNTDLMFFEALQNSFLNNETVSCVCFEYHQE